MCATEGYFAGCQITPRECTIATLRKQAKQPAEDSYASAFDRWYDRSSVRNAPRRMLTNVNEAQAMFSVGLTPLLRSATFRSSVEDSVRTATVQQALRYLHGTAFLESRVVNGVVLDIAESGMGLLLPRRMRVDAYRIYTDEAFHAQFSIELASQITELTGATPAAVGPPTFYRSLLRLENDVDASYSALLRLLFVICSETLITGSLSAAAQDESVAAPLRSALRDHAQDEGRHHVYFSTLLRTMWDQLDDSARHFSALIIPELIEIFCVPDLSTFRAELDSYGITQDTADEIVQETFPTHRAAEGTRASATHLLKLLNDIGISHYNAEVEARYVDHGFA